MKPKQARGAATTPTQIRDAFFDDPAQVTDAQLLALLLGTGTNRSAKGLVRKTWTAIELAGDLLAAAGGRLEHLVAGARRADFDRRRFGLGAVLLFETGKSTAAVAAQGQTQSAVVPAQEPALPRQSGKTATSPGAWIDAFLAGL